MPKIDCHPPGRFCWAELGAIDQNGAKLFYSRLFGWRPCDSPIGPGQTYTRFQIDGLDVAAAYQMGEDLRGVPPHWMIYVAVDDAGEAVKRAGKLGGSILTYPFDVDRHGRMAIIKDPTGAMLAFWQPRQTKGLALVGEENAFCWADLITPDQDRAAEFYTSLFGWTMSRSPGDGADYLHIWSDGEMIGGVPSPANHDPSTPPHWLLYFETYDCDGLAARAEEAGATLVMPPVSLPNVGRVGVIADPQGAVFALYESQNAA
jgi:predicted enzyme related to lactoylglutathione lyase